MIQDPVVQRAKVFLHSYSRFFVLGHREPDGDCVVSQLVVARWLRSRGKTVELLSAGPFDRPEIRAWASHFVSTAEKEGADGSEAVILVDCSHYHRVGLELSQLSDLPLLVIDHHSSTGEPTPAGEPAPGGNAVSLVDPSYPSTSILIFDLLEALGATIDKDMAELLLFGFCTDTGYFRHLNDTHADYMPAVARLVRAGASPQRIYRMIYGNRDLEYISLLGEMLNRIEVYGEGRILLTWQTREDRKDRAGYLRGSDELFRLLLAVAKVEIAVLVKEEDDGSCSVSLRSVQNFDVGRVALRLGGGGHRNASGYSSANSMALVKEEIVDLLAGELEELQD